MAMNVETEEKRLGRLRRRRERDRLRRERETEKERQARLVNALFSAECNDNPYGAHLQSTFVPASAHCQLLRMHNVI